MTLRERRCLFTLNIAKLINYINSKGFEVNFGAAQDSPCPNCGFFSHKRTGKHPDGLAVDLNLYKKGVYLRDTKQHEQFGIYWRTLGGIWGGDFNDGNHYEAA